LADGERVGFAFAVGIPAKGLRMRRADKLALGVMIELMTEQEGLIGAQCPSEVRFIFEDRNAAIRGRNALAAVGFDGGAIFGVSVDEDGLVTMEGD